MRTTAAQMDEGIQYWHSQLAGEIPRLALPLQYPKSKDYERAVCTFEIPHHVSRQLIEISKGKKIALYVALIAAFQSWLGKVNGGQSDIALSIPVLPLPSGDPSAAEPSLLLRNDIDADETFKDVLETVKQSIANGYKHQFAGLGDLIKELNMQQERKALTPLAFAMTGLHRDTDIERLCEDRYDAVIIVDSRSDGGMVLTFHYNGRLFASDAIEIYAKSYVYFLEQICSSPEMRIGELLYIPSEEGQRLIQAFNQTESEFAGNLCIPDLFERQMELAPERVAICTGTSVMTYGELNDRANRLAGLLRQQGIGSGSYVAILLDRSFEMVIGVLGVLKAGAAYVPIEPSFPAARVEAILSSLPVRGIVTKQSVMSPIQELVWKIDHLRDVIYLDVHTEAPLAEEVDSERVRALWDQVAMESVDRVTAGGFISSYNGEPFTDAEVDEYVNRVMDLIPELDTGSSVLEIGCGSGLISFQIANQVNSYIGLDPSQRMLEMNRERSASLALDHMQWLEGYADQLNEMDSSSFDLILMASTVQFFPGYFYLEQIVREAMRCLKPGGTLLIADVMDLRKKDSFIESIRQYRSRHGMPDNDWKTAGHELYCDEDLFGDLQFRIEDIEDMQVLYREKGFANELGYRYDVVLRKCDGIRNAGGGGTVSSEERKMLSRIRHWTQAHINQYPSTNPQAKLSPEDVAYVIFTSGTTGTPKGVVVQHRPVINLVEWVNDTFNVGERDRLLFVTSLCFDLSVYDIFGMLASGGSIRMASEEELSDRERLLDILRQEEITFWDSAPAALQQLALLMEAGAGSGSGGNQADKGDGNIRNGDRVGRTIRSNNLRLVFLSGDWIPLTLPDVMRRHFPEVQVISLGGATEATVWSNYYPVGKVEDHWVSIPYGTPIQNARYYILDAGLNPCPPYIPGDLYIGGECLAAGYTDPLITKERFIPDPFFGRSAQGAKMYKTGDIARWMPDGVMEFLGRSDHQVKIRGYRIEMGDIQAQLLRHPGITEALITEWTDAGGNKSLCAYYTANGELTPEEVKSYLAGQLPEYMIPSYFIPLSRMPVTPNGKLDRNALPKPQDHLPVNVYYEAPANEDEETLAQIWKEVLGIERVGVTDDFYTLGGDSLKAVQVVAKANEYQVTLSLRDMLNYRTIRSIVDSCGLRRREEGECLSSENHAEEEKSEAMGGTEFVLQIGADRQYNLQFEPDLEELPYYYPCMMGAMYAKLPYETKYPIPKGFLPVLTGLGILVFCESPSRQIEDRFLIDDIGDIPGLDLLNGLGIDIRPKVFDTIEDGLAWCEQRLSQGQLVIGVGTTYYLNYSHDYMLDEEEFVGKLLLREQGISKRDEDGIHHSHMFLIVDVTKDGYVVYDSTYHFYGTIPEEEFKRSFAGVGSMEFLKQYPVQYLNAKRTFLDVTFNRLQPIPLRDLALEILGKHIQYYLSSEPVELATEELLVYTGLSVFNPFKLVLQDAVLDGEWSEKLYLFVTFWIRKWKYTMIFYRDFLQDSRPYLELPSMEQMIGIMEESIHQLGGLLEMVEETAACKQEEMDPGRVQQILERVWNGMAAVEAAQKEGTLMLQKDMDLIKERSQ